MSRENSARVLADDILHAHAIPGYEVVGPLACGGMGGIYLGKRSVTGESVALKLLEPHHARRQDVVDRLFSEHHISRAVQHENLLEVRDCGYTETGLPYLVLEYLDGENLGELAEKGRLGIDAILAIGMQIAAGLAALHEAGIAHLDVKPDNVFVLYDPSNAGWPRVKVIDYGVSQFIAEIVPNEAIVAGTPACMAPEQWLGAPCAKSDVYGFGCLMFELLTGDSVFSGSIPELMLAHSKRHPPRASWLRTDTPPDLERLLLRTLSKDPARRPTMSNVVECLAPLTKVG